MSALMMIRHPHPKHPNGTGMVGLDSLHSAMVESLDKALDAMAAAAPHGRDWQDAADRYAYTAARKAHNERLAKLQEIRNDVYDGWVDLRRED